MNSELLLLFFFVVGILILIRDAIAGSESAKERRAALAWQADYFAKIEADRACRDRWGRWGRWLPSEKRKAP